VPGLGNALIEAPDGSLLFTAGPEWTLGQIQPGGSVPATTHLQIQGVSGGGLAFVPNTLAGAGGLRLAGWHAGVWGRLDFTVSAGVYVATGVTTPQGSLEGIGGGFAYVPAGSVGFRTQGILVADYLDRSLGVFRSNAQGDPIPSTYRRVMSHFSVPMGAFFDPLTGDGVVFSTDRSMWVPNLHDTLFVVSGFAHPTAAP
jgi:hypothetical protein